MKKSALQKIEDHEKLCRIMQKQTFEQIKEVKERIARMEKMIIGGAIGIVVALAVFFLAYQKYFNSPFNKELQKKKKSLLKEKQELNERLQKIDQDLKNL